MAQGVCSAHVTSLHLTLTFLMFHPPSAPSLPNCSLSESAGDEPAAPVTELSRGTTSPQGIGEHMTDGENLRAPRRKRRHRWQSVSVAWKLCSRQSLRPAGSTTLLFRIIMKCDVGIRKESCAMSVLTSGTTCCKRISEHNEEFDGVVSSTKVKAVVPFRYGSEGLVFPHRCLSFLHSCTARVYSA